MQDTGSSQDSSNRELVANRQQSPVNIEQKTNRFLADETARRTDPCMPSGYVACYPLTGGEGMSELIDRGAVKLRYFTVARGDFQNLHPQPPDTYFLVTQVFSQDDEYLCSQLLGIDLRAVKKFERQGCAHLAGASLSAEDRDRVQACLNAYAHWIVNRVANAFLGPMLEAPDRIQ